MSVLKGLSFPFQVNSKGGVSLVQQSDTDFTIFDMKLEQLLNTNKGERTMECNVFSELDTFVFEATDASTKTLLEYQIKQAVLAQIPEITVTNVDMYSNDEEHTLMAVITYKVKAYGTEHTVPVRVGDMA